MGKRYVHSRWRWVAALLALVLTVVGMVVGARLLEKKMAVPIMNKGEQLTSHTTARNTAQVFVNGKWYAERNLATVLVMGIDAAEGLTELNSYNNNHQNDFLMLFLHDVDTGRSAAIHINRDTMTDITMLGVTGQPTGTRYAQLALAYNYGSGDHVSSNNVVSAVERLMYGMQVDHYITLAMDAVPIINDWAGGVTVEVLDDFTGIDDSLVQGELIRLRGQQSLNYVRMRKGLDDSSNLHRMERQRQYAEEWVNCAQRKLTDPESVADLVMQLDGHYRSSCTAEELLDFAQNLSANPSVPTYELKGEAVKGEEHMEFYADETALQQLVLELFYVPVE